MVTIAVCVVEVRMALGTELKVACDLLVTAFAGIAKFLWVSVISIGNVLGG
jgi:hypothetical protein